jgi:hypothetical protein
VTYEELKPALSVLCVCAGSLSVSLFVAAASLMVNLPRLCRALEDFRRG